MDRLQIDPAGAQGQRLDSYVASGEWGLSRSLVQKLCDEGRVLVDGKPAKKNHRLTGREQIEIELPAPEPAQALPQEIALDVVFEDEDLIAVNKPRGMVVHPAPGHADGTVVNALLAHCRGSLSGIGGVLRPGIVHRIDKDTSGLMIAAKNDFAHLALARQLKDHSMYRIYEAIVLGSVREDEGIIDRPIARSPKNRKKMAVVEGGRRAVTHYRVLGRCPGYTQVRCRLETGRTHQIRVHLSAIGHPVAGDPLYGGGQDKSGLDGQCLHAAQLIFVHPRTGEEVRLECPLPRYFTEFMDKIGMKDEV